MKTPFLGGAYQAFSRNLDAQRCVNLYLEQDESKKGREVAALRGTPGLLLKATVGNGPIRGMRFVLNTLYVVSGQTLYSVSTSWVVNSLGTLNTLSGPVSMQDNGRQLIVVDGVNGYIVTLSTGVFQQITAAGFPTSPTAVTFFDSFFVVSQGSTQQFWVSASYDGLTWPATNFASKEGGSDVLIAPFQINRQLWLFGQNTTEVWFNAGNVNFPFQRIDGVFIESGIASPYCAVLMDNSIFWLGADQRGQGTVYRSNGYQAHRISTFAIENIIDNNQIGDAIAYAYQAGGHSFYVLVLPTLDKTLVYDVSSNLWHERAAYDAVAGKLHRHASNCGEYFNGLNIVGDWQNGNIYAFDDGTPTDNGAARKWIRSWQALPEGQNNGREKFYSNLEIFMETGQAPQTGQGAAPMCSLRISNDGGHTFPIEQFRSMGLAGQESARIRFQNLGRSNNRVFELSGTDPVIPVFVGAELQVEEGLA